MTRDGAYIHHNDYDKPRGSRRQISDDIYEKRKAKFVSQKINDEEMIEDPMLEAIKKDEHPVKNEEETNKR